MNTIEKEAVYVKIAYAISLTSSKNYYIPNAVCKYFKSLVA